MPNDFYTPTGNPTDNSNIVSPDVRSEFTAINAGFNKLPTLTGNANKLVVINSSGTGMDVTTAPTGLTSINKVAITQPANGATMTIIDGKTLTANNTLTLAGTDGTVMTFPATNATLARTDAANTFTGIQDFDGRIDANAGLAVTGANFTSRGITDSATAKALTLSGSGANSVTIANSASSPAIGTSAGSLLILPGGSPAIAVTAVASSVNYLTVLPSILGGGFVSLGASGSDADINLNLAAKGAGNIGLYVAAVPQVVVLPTASANQYITLTGGVSNGVQIGAAGTTDINIYMVAAGTGAIDFCTGGDPSNNQVRILNTASADRYITMTGSNGGNPTIGTSAGSLALSAAVVAASTVTVGTNLFANGYVQVNSDDATPAGGAANTGLFLGVSAIGVYFGSGAPTVSAAKGSLYLRSDGSSTSTRSYINTDGGTTWTAHTTAA